MDEYVAGCTPMYQTNKIMLEEGLKRLTLLKEDATRLAARDLHELMRAWEQYHRILSGEAHLRHILFREETRYPGYYYRADFLKIDDTSGGCSPFLSTTRTTTSGSLRPSLTNSWLSNNG
jgi:adenylylsulfate reductase subunit A